MKFNIRYLIPVILMAGILFSCRNEIEEIQAMTSEIEIPTQTSYNARYDYTEMGKLRNTIQASQLDRYIIGEQRLEASGGFELIIYNENEQPEAFLTADEGTYFEKKNELKAQYNVILSNINGDSLMTEELFWIQDSAKVFTHRDVVICTDDGRIYGKGLESDEKFTNYTIHNIHGNLTLDETELDAREDK